jgi:hypothetical protein
MCCTMDQMKPQPLLANFKWRKDDKKRLEGRTRSGPTSSVHLDPWGMKFALGCWLVSPPGEGGWVVVAGVTGVAGRRMGHWDPAHGVM